MKKQALKAFALLALCTALAGVAAAAEFGPMVKANVPFDFMVGDVALPAGEYVVNSLHPNVVLFSDRTSAHQVAVQVNHAARNPGAERKTMLVFNKYGEKLYLAQIWSAVNPIGRQALTGREERELIASGAKASKVYLAINLK